MLISGYRRGLFKVLDAVCILVALGITGWFTLPADLSVLDDYTGASLFTVASYLFFFYVLDAYNIGAEDFRDTVGRVLVAFFLGAVASATAFYAFQNWRFDRETLILLFTLCFVFCLGWRALYYKHIGRFVHKPRVLLVGTDREGNEINLLDVMEQKQPDIVEEMEKQRLNQKLYELMESVLSLREKEVLYLRYGLPGGTELTQKEVGKRLGISRSYVSRIEKRALLRLRDAAWG